jgi:hypothetical protein
VTADKSASRSRAPIQFIGRARCSDPWRWRLRFRFRFASPLRSRRLLDRTCCIAGPRQALPCVAIFGLQHIPIPCTPVQ